MDEARAERLYREANAARWDLPQAALIDALDRSAAKAFAGRTPDAAERDRYLRSLHLADLALACACARGHEAAWDHFVAEFRPALYRAADAMAPGGGARDIADALYGELFGTRERDGERLSLFRYFHGRSSLATWLRSLVAQRHVDRIRELKRHEPLPDDAAAALTARVAPPNPDRARFIVAMRAALRLALAALDPRDRLQLACYYAQAMTLAQIGRLTGAHEATVSRQLLRARRTVRAAVVRRLTDDYGFGEAEVTECFASLAEVAEVSDLTEWLREGNPRKKAAADRSMEKVLP